MISRKLQLIAGTSYTVSLPKNWVVRHRLKQKDDVMLDENSDGSITVYPTRPESGKHSDVFNLNVDNVNGNIVQTLFALYYLGFEQVNLFSKKELNGSIRARIQKAISYMSGTEVIHEDSFKISYKEFLDTKKIDIHQLFYRVGLIISSSIEILLSEKPNSLVEIKRNENEVDRLYQLITKLIFLSQSDANMLMSTGINNVNYLISYLLVGKRLEHLADEIEKIADSKVKANNLLVDFLQIVRAIVKRDMACLGGKKKFEPVSIESQSNAETLIKKIDNPSLQNNLSQIWRIVIDIEEELTRIDLYGELIESKTI